MKDAQALFRDGVMAVRERKDVAEGRRLLMESLRRNPHNDMAWVWLARTTSRPEKRLEYIERALAINPANEHALALKAKLMAQTAEPTAPAAEQDNHDGARKSRKTLNQQLTPQEAKQIAFLLKKADHYIDAGDPEAAIEQWVEVLHIQVDHEEAMRNAVSYLARLKYLDDARELVWRAIEAGTPHPSIYLTAIDIVPRLCNYSVAVYRLDRLALLLEVDDHMIAMIVYLFVADHLPMRALALIYEVLAQRPYRQVVQTAMGDLNQELRYE